MPIIERRGACAGFTLIEVLVALVVFALVAVSVYVRVGDVSVQTERLEQRSIAIWLARDALERHRLSIALEQQLPPSGRDLRIVSAFGRDWRVDSDITRSEDDNVLRVEVEVALDGDPEGVSAARLIGYVGPY